jgi:hypothetical protein
MYFNHRAEVWGATAAWLKAGGCQIPDDPQLEIDLTGPQYGYSSKSQIQLERKEDMKSRGLASPDFGDTLAMTFAVNPNPAARIRNEEGFEKYARYRYSGDQEHTWMA